MNAAPIKYVLDANAFIEASRRYYAFDIAPPFWDKLVQLYTGNRICSVDKVYDEIVRGDDELKEWVENDAKDIFQPTDTPEILEKYKSLVVWAQEQQQYTQRAIDTFMDFTKADAWIIAFALENDCKVVTHEAYEPKSKKKIFIPNVCKAYGINYCNTFEMLKEVGFTF